MASQDYSKPSTYTTPDHQRTAELDYQRETLTVFIGTKLVAVLPMDFATLTALSMYELRQIVEGTEEPTEATTATHEHTCDEVAERTAYRQYISDGLADTDGHYAPEDFAAWQAHYHRGIGHQEPRTTPCTAAGCNAPRHEKVNLIERSKRQMRLTGLPRFESTCTTCYPVRLAA